MRTKVQQKAIGVILLAIGILEMCLLPEEATAGFMIILLSMCLILGKFEEMQ